MYKLKRIFTWIIIVISILGILACLAGVVGSWVINQRLTDRILSLLSGVQTQLSSAEGSLVNARDQLNTAKTALQSIHEVASQLGSNAEQNSPLLDKISTIFNEQLSPVINSIRERFNPIREAILSVNSKLETLNALTGLQLPTLTPQLNALNDRIQELSQAVQQLQTSIQEFKTGVVENLLTPFLAKLDQITNLVSNLEQSVNGFLDRIHNLQAAVTGLQASLPRTIDLITILLSILLIWMILAQISLILAGRVYLKTGKMVWEIPPQTQPVEEAVLEPGP
jgi:chromosome segregation ATPase